MTTFLRLLKHLICVAGALLCFCVAYALDVITGFSIMHPTIPVMEKVVAASIVAFITLELVVPPLARQERAEWLAGIRARHGSVRAAARRLVTGVALTGAGLAAMTAASTFGDKLSTIVALAAMVSGIAIGVAGIAILLALGGFKESPTAPEQGDEVRHSTK